MAGSLAMMAAPVSAETADKLTYLTFSGRVQVPGARLGAGTYRFRLANDTTSRNVIQVLSHDGSHVYAMFHTIPDSRTTLTNESTVTFMETPAGVPAAVRSLFYGGEHAGYEFVYPKGEPTLIAEILQQPAIAYTPITAVTETSSVVSKTPEPEPVPEASPAPAPAETAAPPPVAESSPQPAELPHTASLFPLVALSGLTSVFIGLGVGLIRRAVH
jgi:hypothetical protein